MRSKPYVGVKAGCVSQVFRSDTTPHASDFKEFTHVIGPFYTMRGARYMAKFGMDNPNCQTVQKAEKLAKIEARRLAEYAKSLESSPVHVDRAIVDAKHDKLQSI